MRALLFTALLPALALFAAPAVAEEKAPSWEGVFSLAGAPKGVHLTASYVDGKGRSHALELWRDGDSRLRRRTDDKIDLFAEKTKSGDYAFRLVDLAGKRLIEVSRTNLYRIGVFADWPSLAGILARPKVTHTIRREARPVERTKLGECRWFRLDIKDAGANEICWSDRFKVPLLIQRPAKPGEAATTLFQVKQIEAKLPAAEVFKVETRGLAVISADEDIDPSSDM